MAKEGSQVECGTKRITPEEGCMHPTAMAEKPMFPTHVGLIHLMESRMR